MSRLGCGQDSVAEPTGQELQRALGRGLRSSALQQLLTNRVERLDWSLDAIAKALDLSESQILRLSFRSRRGGATNNIRAET